MSLPPRAPSEIMLQTGYRIELAAPETRRITCRYCRTANHYDKTNCVNCGAGLTLEDKVRSAKMETFLGVLFAPEVKP